MDNKFVYEYAVIRIVPDVEREEFLNAGIIFFSKKKRIILCRTFLNQKKLFCLAANADLEQIQNNLLSFEKIASGKDCGSPIAAFDLPSRFRWLTAAKSTVIQCSPVHPGMVEEKNIEKTFEKLFEKLVL